MRNLVAVGVGADLIRAPGLRWAGWNAPKFKLDSSRSWFVMAQSRIGMWLKSESAPKPS